jgi:hypothetical protein
VPVQGDSLRRAVALERLEKEHDLFAFVFDGWSAWRVMRNAVHRVALALPIANPSRRNVGRSLKALVSTLALVWQVVVGQRHQLVVKTCRSGLRVRVGDRFRDVYFDGLLTRFTSRFKLEEINSPDFASQAALAMFPSDLDPVVFTFWGYVAGLLRPARAAAPFCLRISELLASELGVQVEPRWLLMRVSTVYWQSRLYRLLLARLRPDAVLVSDTGEYALRLACLRQGIPFIELQHGVFDRAHPDAVPLWVKSSAEQLLLPDVLACRGSFWIDRLSETRQGRDHAVAVGDEIIDRARERRLSRQPDSVTHFVVTTQGLDSDNLANWLAEAIERAPTGLAWRMSLKLHPVYDEGRNSFASLASHPRVTVIPGSAQPNVYDLLAEADVHLSIASACHFDAAAIGVPSFIIPLSGHESMLPVVDGVQFCLAERPGDIWERRKIDSQALSTPDGSRFATPGFIGNIERLINHLRCAFDSRLHRSN